MEEIRPGLWTWTGEHPEWTPEMTWGPEVRSYAVQIEDERYLIDPVLPAPRADGILLTVPWHRRSADELDIEVLDDPPPGIEVRPGFFAEEKIYWLPQHRAIVIGDAFVDGNAPPNTTATTSPTTARVSISFTVGSGLNPSSTTTAVSPAHRAAAAANAMRRAELIGCPASPGRSRPAGSRSSPRRSA